MLEGKKTVQISTWLIAINTQIQLQHILEYFDTFEFCLF